MPFKKGERHPNQGGNRGGGRPPKHVALAKKMAQDIAREFIETNVQPVLDNYVKLAKGWTEKRFTDMGKEYDEFRYDGATTRHFIDKVLPDTDGKEDPKTGNTFIQFVFTGPDRDRRSIDVGLHNGNGRGIHAGALHIGGNGSKG